MMNKKTPPLLIGINIGTTNCKIVLGDIEGLIIGQSTCRIPLISNKESEAEQNPKHWYAAVREGIKKIAKTINFNPSMIKGMALDSHLEAWVCVNKQGKAIHNGLLWLDRRTVGLAEKIKKKLIESSIISETGVPINYVNPALKIIWIKNNYPELYNSAQFIVSPKDYINFQLTGEVATDTTIASKSMLAKLGSIGWSEMICHQLEIDPILLPQIKEATNVLGTLSKKRAEELGIPHGIPIAVGGGDDYTQALSCGALKEGDLNIGTGTGSAWKAIVDSAKLDFTGTLECHRYFHPKKWVLWTGINSTGFSIQWFLEDLGFGQVSSIEELNRMSSDIDIGCNGLFYYPHLWGARIPRMNPDAKAIFWGLNSSHSLHYLYRSILEGIAYNYITTLKLFKEKIRAPLKITMVGGETQNDLWNKIKADALGMPIYIPHNRMGSPFGSMILAGIAAGYYSSIEEAIKRLVKFDTVIEPNFEHTSKYAELAEEYVRIYDYIEPAYSKKEGNNIN
jgi:xylulokinase